MTYFLIFSMSLSLAAALGIFTRRFWKVLDLDDAAVVYRLRETPPFFEVLSEKFIKPLSSAIKTFGRRTFYFFLTVLLHKMRIWVGLIYSKLARLDASVQKKAAGKNNSPFWNEITVFKNGLKDEIEEKRKEDALD